MEWTPAKNPPSRGDCLPRKAIPARRQTMPTMLSRKIFHLHGRPQHNVKQTY